jgi:dihydroorotase
MQPVSRRDFLIGAAAGGTLIALNPSGALAQSEKFDLVIKGGEVLDPSQKLRARRDVGIKNAVIAALEPEIADSRAKQLLDARGKLVLPGLVDMHAHVYPGVSALGIPADELVPYTATTTYVSAGDAGANTFSAFKHYIVGQARSRIYAFVHISSIGLSGFPVGEMLNIDYADVDQAAKTLAENHEIVLGVKVRESLDVVGTNGIEPLKRAVLACERSGVRGAVPHRQRAGRSRRAARYAAPRRHPHARLLGRWQQYRSERQADRRRARGEEARRDHRRRTWRRELRLHGGRARDPAGTRA